MDHFVQPNHRPVEHHEDPLLGAALDYLDGWGGVSIINHNYFNNKNQLLSSKVGF